MKMTILKKVLLYSFYLSCFNVVYSQTCTITGQDPTRWAAYEAQFGIVDGTILEAYDPATGQPYTIGIALHIITDDYGQGGVSDNEIQQGLIILEDALGQAGIDYVIVNKDTIKNDDFLETTLVEEEYLASTYNIDNAVNIYYIENPTDSRAVYSDDQMILYCSWYTSPGCCYSETSYIIIENHRSHTSTMGHEMGHYFDLFHTYDLLFNYPGNTDSYKSYDLLDDTPNHDHVGGGDCDGEGDELVKAENFMNAPSDCRSKFTPEQTQKIRYVLLTRRQDLLYPWIKVENKFNEENPGGSISVTQGSYSEEKESGSYVKLNQGEARFTTLNERFEEYSPTNPVIKHHNWNLDLTSFLLSNEPIIDYGTDQQAVFNEAVNTELVVNLPDGTYGKIEFKDPWYLHEDGTQKPDEFLIFDTPYLPTGAHGKTTPGIFLNQAYDSYNPSYTVKVNKYYANQDGIYEFDYWRVEPVDGAFFAEINSNQTKLVFNSPNAQITAEYNPTPVNEIPNYTLAIAQEETFSIPAGTNIYCAPGFAIVIDGRIEVLGTIEEPIVFSANPNLDSDILLFIHSDDDYYSGAPRAIIENVEFNNFQNSDDFPVIYLGGNGTILEKMFIRNAIFNNCTYAMEINSDLFEVVVTNSTFYQAPFYPVGQRTDFTNCIFYQSEPATGTGISNSLFYDIPNVGRWVDGYSSNIEDDPMFIDISTNNFHLKKGSPCIDAGVVHYGCVYDPDGTVPDMGAKYYPQIAGGNITENTSWENELSVLGDITIDAGVELIILPATKVYMSPDATINVNGKFTAIGTNEDPIKFTSIYTSPGTSQYWDRIKFNNSADDNSKLEYCIIEYADHGPYMNYAYITLNSNEIHHIMYYGIYGYKSYLTIQNNHIHDIGIYGIYLNRNNYALGESYISGNHIEYASRGVYLYLSSPDFIHNEINNCSYGLYCYYYSSPKLGWMGEEGHNHIHHNGRGVYSYKSSPFMGESMCIVNGGYNIIEYSSTYQVEAKSNSTIEAENNWWENNFNFYEDGTSSVDHIPPLNNRPIFFLKQNSKNPEVNAFNIAFTKQTSGDSMITGEEVMESYKSTWSINKKLSFARNLNFLGFPHLSESICRNIINTFPDSSGAFTAISLLWDAGRLTDEEFSHFKSYLDSLSRINNQYEVHEESELILDGFDNETMLSKKSTEYYKNFKSDEVASNALFQSFLQALLWDEDFEQSSKIFRELKSMYPKSQATLEAISHLGIIQNNFDLPEELIIPDKYELLGNYPNPFNPYTHIKFSIPKISSVEVQIFNILGQKARTLRVDPILPGIYKITWDGKNGNGIRMSSGTYIYRIKAESLTGDGEKLVKSSKMVLLK